ncbi:hypothetical protein LUZ60_011920 [Juncus effusus]|nr:hypothetical protein LUZ60_011920 [Juncus effusus]
MAKSLLQFLALVLVLILSFSFFNLSTAASIPAKFNGFAYSGSGSWKDSILIEAFLDPLCIDSKDSWPSLKKAIDQFHTGVSLIVHPFPLPFHENAYLACRALYIANSLNSSSTFDLLELFFKNQDKYSNSATASMSRVAIQKDMSKMAVTILPNSNLADFESGFYDSNTDSAARVSFRYGCSREVQGAPFFFVNGFLLPGAGSPLSYAEWMNILQPLLEKKLAKNEDQLLSLYM